MSGGALVDWVVEALAEARGVVHKFAAVHLDELDDVEIPTSAAGAASLLRRVVAEFDLNGGMGLTRLAIPIGIAENLDTSPLEELEWQPSGLEPPSLYYFEPGHWNTWTDREEYRRPWNLQELTEAGLDSVYACGRSMSDRTRGWEFSKTLWLSLSRETLTR